MDKRDYEKDWPGLPINYLIVASKEYIVFLDNENDIDWKTTDDFDEKQNAAENKNEYFSVKNEIDCAESSLTNHLDEKVVIGYKRQLGEALVRAFERDFVNARKMLALAQDYILKRNIEQSRYMYLVSCGLTTSISLLVAIIFWLFRDFLILHLGNTVFFITLSVLMGALGAFLSVILRMGKTTLDYSASKRLHFLEGSSKVFAGMISALIVASCIKIGILLPIFTSVESTNIAMALGGIISGASERFAPSIINKLDGVTKTK